MNEPDERRFNLWACCMALLVFGIAWYGIYEATIEYLDTSNGFAATSGMLMGGVISVATYEVLRRWRHNTNSHE